MSASSTSTPESAHPDNQPPLAGLKVIDCSRVLAGPYCATLLGLLGAEVIKVEQPSGDEGRVWPPHRGDMGSSFLALNLNKRSIVLNLKQPAAVEVFKDLVRDADVLVENFKTGEMERFGLDWPVLKQLNSKLIYTSISAFGRQGPKAKDAGYEALVQAYSGAMAITGAPGGEPVRSGVSFLDMSTGVMSALGTMAALIRRGVSGQGGKVETSLLGTSMGLMANAVANYLQHGSQPERMGTAHPQLVPYQAYPTRDGFLFIATGNQGLWERLCRALDQEELITDERFLTNQFRVEHRTECVNAIGNILATYDTQPLQELLLAARVPCSPVNDYEALMADGQVGELGVLVTGKDPDYGEFKVPGLPFSISDYQPAPPVTAPRVGEHTREV
ncbi:MAG: CoA transferase, partial [Gammaproteobacteria bacterium]